jgi:UDP-glucose 4-epimerase
VRGVDRSLVTGGAGFIGSHLAARLAAAGHRVVVLDDLSTGKLSNLDGVEVEFIQGSVTDPNDLARAAAGVDNVFHLAALVGVPESLDDPERTLEINVVGTIRLLMAAAAAGARRFVLSSSSAIYGDDAPVPNPEDCYPGPISPYGLSKLDGEFYLSMYASRLGLHTVALRYFNVFGPRQDPHSPYAAVIPIFIDRALAGKDLVIFGDGGQTRDFISVKDVAAANMFALAAPAGVYNVGCGGRITVNDLAAQIIDLTGSSSAVVHEPARPGDIYHSQADVTRITAAGFRPTVRLDDGLMETIRFFREHPPG